jgi:hypothetical protein
MMINVIAGWEDEGARDALGDYDELGVFIDCRERKT